MKQLVKQNHVRVGIAALGVILFLNFYLTKKDQQVSEQVEQEMEIVDQFAKLEYGLPVDSFVVHKGKFEKNQFLADILLKHHVPYPEIDHLVKVAKDTFDVRNIRSGKNFCVLAGKDSAEKCKVFIYEKNPVDYVVFDMRDSVSVYTGKKEVVVRENVANGTIESSLYETLKQNNLSPALAMELSEIYAWTIDFYRIQKGDEFNVIFEEKYVNDEFVGIGKIKCAKFKHWNEEYYAFAFEQEGAIDFFDEKANSLRKAFLKSPLKFSRISSSFSRKRFHPVQKRYKAHLGTDYAAPRGTPIMAVGDGVVVEATRKKYNGKYVKIRHNNTYTTQYLHMNKIASGMKPGKKVRQGDIIGYVGSTGLATGPHVCFRFWKNGSQVDHRKQKFPPSKPVNPNYLNQYQKLVNELKGELEGTEELAVTS